MIVPMRGTVSFVRRKLFVVERLYWRGRPLPIGLLKLRWLLPASRVGYDYPGRKLPDVLDRPDDDRSAA